MRLSPTIVLGAAIALASAPAYARPFALPTIPAAPVTVVDHRGGRVGYWQPDMSGSGDYAVLPLKSVNVIAAIEDDGIKGGADYLYFETNCDGDPFIQEFTGTEFYQTRLSVPYQETFSLRSNYDGSGISPLYYADSTNAYQTVTVCAAMDSQGVCNPIFGCEQINAYPALSYNWGATFTLPFQLVP